MLNIVPNNLSDNLPDNPPKQKPAILIGLIGTHLQFSRAPQIHMQEGELNGLRYLYRLIDLAALEVGVDALPELLTSAERMGFNGLAITHPCKEAIIPHLTELSPDAMLLGAVNTVLLKDGKRVGHNTDWYGYAASFQRDMASVKKTTVVQLGAGGAGKAVAHALLSSGVEHLALWVRNPDKAAPVVESLGAVHGKGRISLVSDLEKAVAAADGLVNATPIGMDAHPGCPISLTLLRPDLWVSDLIYSPAETPLLRAAKEIGALTRNGMGMFFAQAAEQFRLFTDIDPDQSRMQAHMKQLVSAP